MIEILTRNPLTRSAKRLTERVTTWLSHILNRSDKGILSIKAFMGAFLLGLGLLFAGTLLDYRDATEALRNPEVKSGLDEIPSLIPLIFQGFGVFLSLVAFLVSLWVKETTESERRRAFVVISLSLAALASLAVWLPTDIIETQAAISGKALAGETPSIPAYFGKLFLISLLILSIPVAALLYFRLSLMDRYVVHNFLSPFSFCLFSFMAIWVIADFTDNGGSFSGLSFGRILTFYVVQIPFVILFVMPIAVLLSGLFSMSKMSKSNELISMIGSGRSVIRILVPLIAVGVYASLIGLAFKYEWAPASIGYKEAILETAERETWVKKHGQRLKDDIWAKRGWMHVNEPDKRSWFVGRVPFTLSDEMGDVVVMQLDERDQPTTIWIAKRAKWVWNANPPKWVLSGVRVYTYDKNHIPRIESKGNIEMADWSETPWKVLSSSQNPEYLGVPGLTMYLNANRELDDLALASFRTNWWYIFAEPLACLVLLLVAAPLGIVYSRRGAMGGVTGAIVVFALMYVMRGTFLAMGHSDRMSPFLAAWLTNILVGVTGLILLWLKARNREIPKVKTLLRTFTRRLKPGRAA
jgi:lipopolysaccharide export system permease protein